MPKQNNDKDYVKPANTFIDQGVTLKAQKLSGSESVRIDGRYIGNIDLDGYLQIGEPGRIEGSIQVSYALIAGEILGDVLCRATVHLSPTARVYGDITTDRIIIDEGAVFVGLCKTRDNEPDKENK